MNEQTLLKKSKNSNIIIDEWEEILVIAKNHTHPVIYDIFAEFYNEWKLDLINTVEEENFDEYFGSEYFISLWQHTKTKHWIIWGSHGLEATIEFETFWIIFPEKLEVFAKLIQQKFKKLFEQTYFEDESKFRNGLIEILKMIDDANERSKSL